MHFTTIYQNYLTEYRSHVPYLVKKLDLIRNVTRIEPLFLLRFSVGFVNWLSRWNR